MRLNNWGSHEGAAIQAGLAGATGSGCEPQGEGLNHLMQMRET